MGASNDSKRSNFHLNDPNRLKALIKEAGFSRVLTYFTVAPAGLGSIDEAMEFYLGMPSIAKMRDHEKYGMLVQVLRERLTEIFEREETINFECLVAIAYK